jgi:ATP-binding protein involved in chromosome partitioning
MLPRSEVLVVTTPATAAQKVAVRVVDMARKNYLRIVGVVENMSVYVDDDGNEHRIFGAGGGARLAEEAGVPLVAEIPIEPAVSEGGDVGSPAALGQGPAAEAFRSLAALLVEELVPPVDLASCSARLFDAVDAALAAADATD